MVCERMKRSATKILRAGFILIVVFLFCAFALLPQPVRAQTVTATVPVGSGPEDVAVTPNGAYAYVTNYGTFGGGTTVSVINTATNTVTATITGFNSPDGVAVTPNGAYVYVANSGNNSVSVISTATNSVTTTIPVGNDPISVALTPNGAYAYVTNWNSGTVSVINTTTNTVTATVPVGTGPTSAAIAPKGTPPGLINPVGVAVTPNGKYAYVTNEGNESVSVISTATNKVTATVTVGIYPYAVAVTPNGACVYVTNDYSGSVSVISTATNSVTATVPGLFNPVGVAVTPNGQYAYVTNNNGSYGGGSVSMISTTMNTVTATVPVGSGPEGVAVTPNGAYAYVTNWNSDTVSVISTGALTSSPTAVPTAVPTATPTVAPTSTIPEFPWMLAILTLLIAVTISFAVIVLRQSRQGSHKIRSPRPILNNLRRNTLAKVFPGCTRRFKLACFRHFIWRRSVLSLQSTSNFFRQP